MNEEERDSLKGMVREQELHDSLPGANEESMYEAEDELDAGVGKEGRKGRKTRTNRAL